MRYYLVVLSILCSSCWAANILYINGVPSRSHFIWHRALIYGLAAKGHNVTAVSVDIEDNPPANVSFIHVEDVYESMYQLDSYEEDFFRLMEFSPFTMLKSINDYGLASCIFALQSEGFRKLLAYPDDFKVDVIISDYLHGPCMTAIAQHKFGRPPLIGATAFIAFTTATSMSGAFSYSGIVPNHEYDISENMNYKQRFMNFLYNHWEELLKIYQMTPKIDGIVRKLVPDIPYVDKLEKETRIVLLNSNPVIQYSEPSMSNVIAVGGMQISEPKKLPANLKTIVDTATNGAILFSLGSNVRSDQLGNERIIEILNAMEQFPQYQFLWKFESNTLPVEIPRNVHIHKWLPQNDLLAHPNLKLFITHSGLMSYLETVWHGVPIIGFPLFADQYPNINYCVDQGAGKRLSLKDVNSKVLASAIREVMNDESYRNNMTRLSKLFRDQQEHPLERAIWWVEWVLRNPDTMILRSRAVGMNWFVKYSFDVIVPLVLVGLIAVMLSLKILWILLCSSTKQGKSKRE